MKGTGGGDGHPVTTTRALVPYLIESVHGIRREEDTAFRPKNCHF